MQFRPSQLVNFFENDLGDSFALSRTVSTCRIRRKFLESFDVDDLVGGLLGVLVEFENSFQGLRDVCAKLAVVVVLSSLGVIGDDPRSTTETRIYGRIGIETVEGFDLALCYNAS
jgi:hypothetical protein